MTIVLGRLVQATEAKQIDINGEMKTVLNNTIARRNPHNKNEAVFIDITAWGGLAEVIAQNLGKGDEALFIGELRNKKTTIGDKTITTVYLRVDKIEFTNGRKRNEAPNDETA